MKMLMILSLLFFSSVGFADVIECSFTEPFIDSHYDSRTGVLLYKFPDKKQIKFKNVELMIKGPAEFDLVLKDGTVLQSLNLNFKGSDGMSDIIYPYEVKDYNSFMTANLGWGGCVSKRYRSWEPQE